MNIVLRIQSIFAIVAFSFLIVAADEPSPPKPSKVYQVKEVELSAGSVTRITVRAKGTVRTGGWTQPRLIPSSDPADSNDSSDVVTRHFDFVATKPTGVVTDAITPITAETSVLMPGVGKTLKVVVHAETNEKENSIGSTHDRP